MIAACPTCGARYRIDVAKLPPDGARLRCARCEAVFRVRPPAETAGRGAEVPAPRAPAQAPAAAARGPARVEAQAPAAAVPARDSARLILVADPEPASGKALCGALGAWGYEALLVHDGVEAILAVQRSLPRAVVLDAALPKMFGFQVCELIKRNESLRGIQVVLVGAIHDQARYRRPPGDLYGADAYVERHELPDALPPILQRLGLAPQAGAGAHADVAPRRAPARAVEPAAPAQAPAAAARAPAGDGLDDARAQAERLARIIVSDIVLYNAAKFEAGVRAGDVISALDVELEEGRALFAARIDPRVGAADEFLQRELLRVARTRGMVG